MAKSFHVLIVGGGISGLTLANLLIHGSKKVAFKVTLFEARSGYNEESIGGGIGLWPTSQAVLRNLPNYQNFMEQFSYCMPFPSYRNPKGKVLARANDDFAGRFPVRCLNRHDLINLLWAGLKDGNIEVLTDQKIMTYEREDGHIIIRTNEKLYKGDLLIACDGIHSKMRTHLLAELNLPPVAATDLGYTYFRANVQLPMDSEYEWWSVSFETWGTCKSSKYGNYQIRFGYVPLKPPVAFWFIAIKTQENHPYLSPIKGVHLVDESTKEFLLDLIRNWEPVASQCGKAAVNYEELIQLTSHILRTDIAKIKEVGTIPWQSQDGRVVLLGDAAHAIAPNLAQGAGLCIEDAACLAAQLNRIDYVQGLPQYVQERKPRCHSVQKIADSIATIGQAKNPLVRFLRDGGMRLATVFFPALQQCIFEYIVSLSLGGSARSLYWQVPRLGITDDAPSSLFGRVFSRTNELNQQIKEFKISATGGKGFGYISVEKPGFFGRLLGWLAGLPAEMDKQPFYAEVNNLSQEAQRWKRVFAYKTPQQKTYTTTHTSYCDFKRRIYLSEGVGGRLDKWFRFLYRIKLEEDKSLRYESKGITLFHLCRIPLPNFLLPKSIWTERPCAEGWIFDGKISLPGIGTIFHYFGSFRMEQMPTSHKRVIVAGGSGMIGTEVCRELVTKGYDVYCLSRSLRKVVPVEGVKIRRIDEDWSDLIDHNTLVVNLSGANPGARRWSTSVKSNIAQSRFKVIDTIIANINKAEEKPCKYIQASAAGFYGDAGDVILTEEDNPKEAQEPGTKFRIEVCREIEDRAQGAQCNVVNLRIGHVLANNGGILPYFRYAGFFNVGKLGSGTQFVPFVHINDVARAIEFLIHDKTINHGAVNVAAPNPCTNLELLRELRWKWGPGIKVPQALLKLVVGESSVVLTDSERLMPQRLLEAGFKFEFNTIAEALHGLQ